MTGVLRRIRVELDGAIWYGVIALDERELDGLLAGRVPVAAPGALPIATGDGAGAGEEARRPGRPPRDAEIAAAVKAMAAAVVPSFKCK